MFKLLSFFIKPTVERVFQGSKSKVLEVLRYKRFFLFGETITKIRELGEYKTSQTVKINSEKS